MKRILLTNLAILLILGVNAQLFAQKDKNEKDKTVKLKYERIENGKKVVTDTTFTLKKGENLNKALEKYGVRPDSKFGRPGTFDMKIETDDSVKHGETKMVWVNVDKDGNGKKVMINEDADVDVFEDEDLPETNGNINDSIKRHIEKDIVKGTKHKKIKKVYKFDNGNMVYPHHQMMSFNHLGDNINKVIIKELNNDSIEVNISKIFDKEFDIPFETNFIWTGDGDFDFNPGKFKHFSSKYKFDNVGDADLKKINIENNYKKLDLEEFMVVFNSFGASMDLSFTCEDKGDLSLNVYDENGNSDIVIELKDFKGKFEKEIKLPKGNLLLLITQNKKHFVKKLIAE